MSVSWLLDRDNGRGSSECRMHRSGGVLGSRGSSGGTGSLIGLGYWLDGDLQNPTLSM
jgi:hypothetical protein